MKNKAILLTVGGILIGALTFGALGVNAQAPENQTAYRGSRVDNDAPRMHNRGFIAELLGMDFEEFRDQIQSGKTLDEIVTSHGFDSLDSFKAAVEDEIRSRLSEAGMSEEEINERIEMHRERIEERIEHPGENFRHGPMKGHGLRDGSGAGHHGMMNPAE